MDMEVGVAHAAGCNLDEDLVCLRTRILEFFDDEGAVDGPDHRSLHR